MFTNLYFFIGLLIFTVQLARFSTYRENDAFARRKGVSLEEYTPGQKLYLGFQVLVMLPYLVLGLLTDQWWLFVFWWGFSPLLSLLTKRWYATRKAHSVLNMAFTLFIILNHFHLHLTPGDFGIHFLR